MKARENVRLRNFLLVNGNANNYKFLAILALVETKSFRRNFVVDGQ